MEGSSQEIFFIIRSILQYEIFPVKGYRQYTSLAEYTYSVFSFKMYKILSKIFTYSSPGAKKYKRCHGTNIMAQSFNKI